MRTVNKHNKTGWCAGSISVFTMLRNLCSLIDTVFLFQRGVTFVQLFPLSVLTV